MILFMVSNEDIFRLLITIRSVEIWTEPAKIGESTLVNFAKESKILFTIGAMKEGQDDSLAKIRSDTDTKLLFVTRNLASILLWCPDDCDGETECQRWCQLWSEYRAIHARWREQGVKVHSLLL